MGSYNFVSDIHDNCVIFSKASKNTAWNIKEVLQEYCKVFGQLIN